MYGKGLAQLKQAKMQIARESNPRIKSREGHVISATLDPDKVSAVVNRNTQEFIEDIKSYLDIKQMVKNTGLDKNDEDVEKSIIAKYGRSAPIVPA